MLKIDYKYKINSISFKRYSKILSQDIRVTILCIISLSVFNKLKRNEDNIYAQDTYLRYIFYLLAIQKSI